MGTAVKTEKRRGVRVEVRGLEITARDTGELIGTLVNLSFGGMLINSAASYDVDSAYFFRIPFKDEFLGREHFDINAECVWCNNNVDSEMYSLGFRFLPESAEQIILLDQIHSKFSVKH